MDDSPFEVAVLDLAGTTVSDPGIVEAAVRTSVGSKFQAELFHQYRGGSKLDMLAALVGAGQALDALETFESELVSAIEHGSIEPLPHAEAALRDLHDAGIRTCLSTGFSPAVRSVLISKLGWDASVDLALSPDEQLRGRPAPDLILAAALHLRVSAMQCVAVVGDTANDVTAARRAGAGVAAGVLTGAHDRATLEAAAPTHILPHVGAFADLVLERVRGRSREA